MPQPCGQIAINSPMENKLLYQLLYIVKLSENIVYTTMFTYVIFSTGGDDLARFLMFCTGVSCIPPMGFHDPSIITVTSTESVLPNANTCPMDLEIPSKICTFEEFCKQMDMAIEYQATGFGVP